MESLSGGERGGCYGAKLTRGVRAAVVREESWGDAPIWWADQEGKEEDGTEKERVETRGEQRARSVPMKPGEERFEEGPVDMLEAGQGFAVP